MGAMLVTGRTRTLRFDFPPAQGARLFHAAECAAGSTAGKRDILSYRELKPQEQRNLVGALERTNRKVSGAGVVTDLPGLKPTALAFGIKAMGRKRPHGSAWTSSLLPGCPRTASACVRTHS